MRRVQLAVRPVHRQARHPSLGMAAVLALALLAGCADTPDTVGDGPALVTYPGNPEGARSVAAEFTKPDAEFAAGTRDAREFPSGYAMIAPHLAPRLTIHLPAFSRPGESFGVRMDGLANVDGRWRIFPAPWEVLEVGAPGQHH